MVPRHCRAQAGRHDRSTDDGSTGATVPGTAQVPARPGSSLMRSGSPRTRSSAWPRPPPRSRSRLTLAALAAAAAYGGGPVIILWRIPMLIIANAYRRLNLWNANCGASFEWVGRAINPYLGFMTGWLMIAGYIIGTIAGVVVLAPSVLAVFGASATSTWPNIVIATAVIRGHADRSPSSASASPRAPRSAWPRSSTRSSSASRSGALWRCSATITALSRSPRAGSA